MKQTPELSLYCNTISWKQTAFETWAQKPHLEHVRSRQFLVCLWQLVALLFSQEQHPYFLLEEQKTASPAVVGLVGLFLDPCPMCEYVT